MSRRADPERAIRDTPAPPLAPLALRGCADLPAGAAARDGVRRLHSDADPMRADAPVGLLVLDRHGTVLDVDDVACRILGCGRGALLGDVLPARLGVDPLPTDSDAPASGARWTVARWTVARWTRDDGAAAEVRVGCTPLPRTRSTADQRTPAHLVTLLDLEPQRRLERRLDFLLETGLLLQRPPSDPEVLDLVVERAARALCDACVVERVQGGGEAVVVSAAAADPVLRARLEAWRAGERVGDAGSLTALVQDAWPRAAVMHVPLADANGPLGAATFAWRDAPEETATRACTALASRLALVLQLRRALSDAERAAEARDEALAAVAHDLRTPLATATLAIGAIRDGLPPASPGADPAADERLVLALRALDWMRRLVDGLLDATVRDADVDRLRREPVDVVALVERALAFVQAQASHAGVVLVGEVSPGLPPLRADTGALERVLLNLLANACRFTPPGGRVALAAAALPPDAALPRGGVRLAVRDTGCGIDPALRRRLLDPAGGARVCGAADGFGLGLGLQIVRRIAEAHGGRLRLESEPGVGTTAGVDLPAGD